MAIPMTEFVFDKTDAGGNIWMKNAIDTEITVVVNPPTAPSKMLVACRERIVTMENGRIVRMDILPQWGQ